MKRRARGGNKFVSQSLQTINLLVRSLIMFEQKISTNLSSNKSLNSSDCARAFQFRRALTTLLRDQRTTGKNLRPTAFFDPVFKSTEFVQIYPFRNRPQFCKVHTHIF